MSDADVAYLPAHELSERIRTKQLSSLEATDYFIRRIEAKDADLNAVVVRDFDRARDDARERDRQLARGDSVGPLHGLPMTIKEQYHRAGLPTTFGYPELVRNVPTWDSDVASALQAAGAVLTGKTNVPLGGADFQSYNEVYGTTNNPWDLARSPGGSSGGSAAALAAGLRQAFWSGLVTAPYLPSTVFPTGLSRRGLPIGLQAVGGAYRDYQTIDFTRLLAKEIGGFRRPPADWGRSTVPE